jgi:hypothetical protein
MHYIYYDFSIKAGHSVPEAPGSPNLHFGDDLTCKLHALYHPPNRNEVKSNGVPPKRLRGSIDLAS